MQSSGAKAPPKLWDFSARFVWVETQTYQSCPVTKLMPDVSTAVLLFVTSALVLSASASYLDAQQPLSLADADQRGSEIFQQSGSTGMVLVVVRNRDVTIKGYGETAPGNGVRPDANSVVRLCSISKIFAGELLTELASEGKVRLSDPLQRFAPAKRIVPKGAGGAQITLEELATHTSGLPREVGSYPANTPHFTFPDESFRWRWLPNQRLLYRPGTAAVYSNIGFDLLGDALAAATRRSYAQLLSERIVRPLGLWDTTLVPNKGQCARLLAGTGDEGSCTETLASGASGGLYSTSNDMARVMQSLLRVPGAAVPPSPVIAVSLKPAQLKSVQGLSHAGDPTGIGPGWIQIGEGSSALLEKTGGGAGFATYIALIPGEKTGIFVAATDGIGSPHFDLFHEVNNLLADLANVPPVPPRVRAARTTKKKTLHRRAKIATR
jgi:serine-type D-Ala-D-Ala carboxypeptidase/endopeptidase